jgi:hypothetical protein
MKPVCALVCLLALFSTSSADAMEFSIERFSTTNLQFTWMEK